MENLGNINITIRDGAGGGGGGFIPGGGGGGTPGGGPGPGSSAPLPPPVRTMFERFQGLLQKFGNVSSMFGEVGGAIKVPSIANLTNLLAGSSGVATALAATGAAALPLAAVLTGVVAGGVALRLSFSALQWGAETVRRRFEELTRFSPAMMFASATERFAQLSRQMLDAQRNGMAYARAQAWATRATDEWAAVSRNLGKIAADLGAAFHALSYSVARILRGFTDMIALIYSVIDVGKIVLNAFTSVAGVFFGPVISAQLKAIIQYLVAIASNTQPQRTAGINNWFLADVQAMTKRGYPQP